jgi:hypothetical protein
MHNALKLKIANTEIVTSECFKNWTRETLLLGKLILSLYSSFVKRHPVQEPISYEKYNRGWMPEKKCGSFSGSVLQLTPLTSKAIADNIPFNHQHCIYNFLSYNF